jgi:FMN reductase
MTTTRAAVGISGSPSPHSRSRRLLEHALARLREHGLTTALVDLSALPADALLGRSRSPDVAAALALVAESDIVVASTPVYRATYTGLLKIFFDLFEQNALTGKIALGLASGGSPGHRLVLDHGLRPLFGSVGAVVGPSGVYAVDDEFAAGEPSRSVLERIDRAVAGTVALSEGRLTSLASPAHPGSITP